MEQIENFGIQIYPIPGCDDDEDEEYKIQCQQLKVREMGRYCLILHSSCLVFFLIVNGIKYLYLLSSIT